MKSIYCTLILLLAIAVSSVAQSPASDSKPASTPAPRKQDKAAAYYHYTLAHMYEEQVAVYGRSELANKAIEEYRLAIEADPTSEYLTSALAELYAKTGRIRDAVMEAQDILKRDPNNLEAHKLLGRIYLAIAGRHSGRARARRTFSSWLSSSTSRSSRSNPTTSMTTFCSAASIA